jgi:surface protein
MRKNRANNGYIGLNRLTPYDGSMAPSNVNREVANRGMNNTVENPYTAPSNGGGYGATASVQLSPTGELEAVYIGNLYSSGTAYNTNILFRVSGGGGPTAYGVVSAIDTGGRIRTTTLYRKVSELVLENAGKGYTNTSATLSPTSGVAAASFTASISGTTLDVTAVSSGLLIPGSLITTSPVLANTIITDLGTGRGGTGTYVVNNSQTVTSRSMTTSNTLTGTMTMNRVVTGVSLTYGGLYNSNTVISFAYLNAGTPEQEATFTANYEKFYYSSIPTVTFLPPLSGSGSTAAGATATPLLLYTIASIGVSNGGQNYTSPPTVSFNGTDKISATAVISGGTVSAITGVSSGVLFTSVPNVEIGGWVDLPSVTAGEDKFVGSYAVYDSDNYVAFIAGGSTYNVDWGDGTTGIFNNGATASKIYSSATFAGITNNSINGYKPVIITATPVSGGRFTSLNFNVRHPSLSSTSLSTQWLNMKMAGSTLATLTVSPITRQITHRMLESFEFVGDVSNIANTSYMFYNGGGPGTPMLRRFVGKGITSRSTTCAAMFQSCTNLREVGELNTPNVTDMSSMFASCNALENAPVMNTINVTAMSQMFQSCPRLQQVPLYNTSRCLNMSQMFQNCSRLTALPMFDTSNVTNFSYMFSACRSLTNVPLFDTKKATSTLLMFDGCSKLRTVPKFDLGKVTDVSSMFANCTQLLEVPLFNTCSVTVATSMFSGCSSLRSVPPFNTKNVISIGGMFSSCVSLTECPQFDFSKATTLSSMFSGCTNLKEYGNIDAPFATLANSMFSTCTNLRKVGTLYLPACSDLSSMFSSCTVLESPPEIIAMGSSLSGTVSFSSMFQSCSSLKYLPLFNVSTSISNTTVSYSSMFNSVPRVAEIPEYDFIGSTGSNNTSSFSNIFSGMNTLRRIRARNFCQSFSLPNPNMMGATALNELYTNLAVVGASGAGAKTITVTGSLGTAGDNPAIATAKGWTVTG